LEEKKLAAKVPAKIKAAVYLEIDKYEVQSFPKTPVGSTSILMKTELCGVCATDMHNFHGRLPIPMPSTVGHEYAGRIVEMGNKAAKLEATGKTLEVGDLVTVCPLSWPCYECWYDRFTTRTNKCRNVSGWGLGQSTKPPPYVVGGFSEYAYADLKKWPVYKVPKEWTPEMTITVEPFSVGWHGVERAHPPGAVWGSSREGFGPGQTVVVQGGGPIGIASLVAAKIAGAGKLIVIEMHDLRLKMAEKWGADHIIDMKAFKTPEERIKEVKRLTDGIGADVVMECTGFPAACWEGIELCRDGGTYVEIGHFTDVGVAPNIKFFRICDKEIDIRGSWGYHATTFGTSIPAMNKAIDEFPWKTYVTHTFKLEELLKAFDGIVKGTVGKAALKP